MSANVAPSIASRAGYRNVSSVVLWVCIALFFVRVVGQIEVLLLAPIWLPEMSAWYSGLLPYPVLLPLQIALLMLMCGLAVRSSTMSPDSPISRFPGATLWRALALLYFVTMAVRLAICFYTFGGDFYLHGGIPIAFHWVLALFMLCCSAPRPDSLVH